MDDLREDWATNESWEKARQYGITAVPAIAVDGVLLDWYRRSPIDVSVLLAASIGEP
jgi:hypothetical protein